MKEKSKKLLVLTVLISVFLLGCEESSAEKVIVYKSESCGCCVQHSAYLRGEGFDVEIVIEDDMSAIKDKYNIPKEMLSCHTAIFGEYFVEGHVPIEAINKLLEEQPEIDGIALPEMPSGSPGMPGPKLEPFVIYQLIDGDYSVYINI